MVTIIARVLAVVIFALLAFNVVLDSDQLRWAFGASALFVVSFLTSWADARIHS